MRGPTLQGESTGSTSIEAREAMLVEVDQLRTHLLSQANATDLNRPAFGGTATFGTTDDAAGSYLGDAAAVRRTVDDGVTLRIDITGAEAFSPAAADLFASPTQIAPHLRTDFTQLEAHLGQLDTVTRRVRATLGDIGAPMNRLEISREAGPARGDNVTDGMADAENIDLAKTTTRLQIANSVYQAALGATSRVVQPSLMDFLR